MITKLDTTMLACLGLMILSSSWLSSFDKSSYAHARNIDPSPGHTALNIENNLKHNIKTPNFSAINDTKRKKKEFFSFMLPLIHEENNQLLIRRTHAKQLQKQKTLTDIDKQWLAKEANSFDINTANGYNQNFFTHLLESLDIVPPSLALVQSANESAWGTSRFARKGNNFFGQWCFSKGCGIVPSSRPSDATYEVRSFTSVFESVRSYMHNLNTSHHYKKFRDIRAKKRQHKEPITGPVLAEGLQSYSTRGNKYVEELIDMIDDNKLASYDTQNSTPET